MAWKENLELGIIIILDPRQRNIHLVYIKKLEIYGFKSFGFKNVVLNLDRGLIAITGPNGSGKSNILDAIMFAIGENSPRLLRVDRFQSLFHDSQNSSNRTVRVSLTFDNQDRGIPIDKDSVVLTREIEGQTGESQYYLNSKKVAKNVVTELLEIVVATPNKLNIVQQGMITRISELNSEERRKIIEDIIGLSYFDEKKSEALKQLEASDRRLEVALARIGEIRKRIDELEIERNEQLRYSHLELELKRFNALKLSDDVSRTKISCQAQEALLQSRTAQASVLSDQVSKLRSEIEKLEANKMIFLQQVDAANKTKSEIDSRISHIIYDYERKKAMAKESEQRCIQIKEKILPLLDTEINGLDQKLSELQLELYKKQNPMSELSERFSNLKHELDNTDSKIESLSKRSMQTFASVTKLEQRFKQLEKIKNNIDGVIVSLEEKVRLKSQQAIHNDNKIAVIKNGIVSNRNQISVVESVLNAKKTEMETTETLITQLEAKKRKVESETSDLRLLLEKAISIDTEYEFQASAARDMMNEDYAIAEITRSGLDSAIRGLVCDLITWEKRYEKSVLAAGVDLMKAIVVDDVRSMLSLLEFAKTKKLPRLKIISLDLLRMMQKADDHNNRKVDENNANIIGTLNHFVYSEFIVLPDFLFANIYLVKNARSAYLLAMQGYRAVSVDGELFEPLGPAVCADFGSKIARFSEALLLGDFVNELRNSAALLKRSIENRDFMQKEVNSRFITSQNFKNRLEMELNKLYVQKSILADNLDSQETILRELIAENHGVRSEINSDSQQLEAHIRRLSVISSTLGRTTKKLDGLDNKSLENALAQANWKRNTILKSVDDSEYELRKVKDSVRSLENEIEIYSNRIDSLKKDREQNLKLELEERGKEANDLFKDITSQESELKKLRDQEQQLIDSSGNSFTILQEYEKKIRTLTENERKILREYHGLEKDIAVLKKDIIDLGSKEKFLISSLNQFGYDYDEGSLVEMFDVEEIIQQLTSEYEALRPRINLRAHDNYIQVIEGYRGMSTRKNQLEEERNSIVLFVEEIDKEKKSVFLEAFKKVDTNLRKMFSEVAGEGSQAWLEIENFEDVFSSGIMLMVQFPGKPARESRALSGGEKTMAGTIFLLALQSLKPSPFYLLDEVDAHLDSQNTDRLSKVLLSRSMDSNQIIMVTLKDSTVSKASLIYGVYPKQGVSQIIKYKHDNQHVLAKASDDPI
ncbi:MAG TPA: chromosome segregation SMC family protein [Nitrososphaeraceae archaeon]|nr:chromosome segregation SMC family protein [Nitrososphaeraceae archaeon]